MQIAPEVARQHIAYNIWATSRLLDAIASLPAEQLQCDFGTADRSIFGTLAHLLRSETAWLGRVQQREASSALPPLENAQQLAEAWRALHGRWSEFIAAVDSSQLESVYHYHDLKGNARSNALWEILLHVVNHSTHHRGQISGFLRASGIVPPVLDYIAYVRLQREAAQPQARLA